MTPEWMLDRIIETYVEQGFDVEWWKSENTFSVTLRMSKVMADHRKYDASFTISEEVLGQLTMQSVIAIANFFDPLFYEMQQIIIKEFKNDPGE
jgi:hypothetical protein